MDKLLIWARHRETQTLYSSFLKQFCHRKHTAVCNSTTTKLLSCFQFTILFPQPQPAANHTVFIVPKLKNVKYAQSMPHLKSTNPQVTYSHFQKEEASSTDKLHILSKASVMNPRQSRKQNLKLLNSCSLPYDRVYVAPYTL